MFLLNTVNNNLISSLNFHSSSTSSLIAKHCNQFNHVLSVSSVRLRKTCKTDSQLPTYQAFELNVMKREHGNSEIISIGHNIHDEGLLRPFKAFL